MKDVGSPKYPISLICWNESIANAFLPLSASASQLSISNERSGIKCKCVLQWACSRGDIVLRISSNWAFIFSTSVTEDVLLDIKK